VCRRITGSKAEAEDAAQEAMIGIVRGLTRFDGRSAFSTWVYRIATNAALDELRRQRRRPALHVVNDEEGRPRETIDPAAEQQADAVADRMSLETALAGLAEDFRLAVVLRDVADLDYGEIAEILDVPVGTVKSRIARGRAQLATTLGNRDTLAGRPTTEPPLPPNRAP
jgi:RNA polymerase sigma-70 factor (ECF subfamily)